MKTLKSISMMIAGLCLAGNALAAMSDAERAAATGKIKAGDAVLLDVREADELEGGMASKASWLPTSDIQAKNGRFDAVLKNLPKDKTIYVYCAAGGRASNVASMLKEKGYKAESFGGIGEVRSAGLETKPVAGAKGKGCPYLCPHVN